MTCIKLTFLGFYLTMSTILPSPQKDTFDSYLANTGFRTYYISWGQTNLKQKQCWILVAVLESMSTF